MSNRAGNADNLRKRYKASNWKIRSASELVIRMVRLIVKVAITGRTIKIAKHRCNEQNKENEE